MAPIAILARLVRQAAVIWLTVRVALLVVGVTALFGMGYAVFAVVCGALSWVDVGYSRERILLGNLGVRPQTAMVIGAVVALGIELAVGGAFTALLGGLSPGIGL